MATVVRRLSAAGAIGLAGLVLSACGQAGLSGVKAACDHVEAGLRAYDKAQALPTNDSQRDALRSQTRRAFMTATHFAARAAVQNGHWTAFATSLTEVHRVGIDSVVPTLRMQCATVRSGNYYY